MNINEVENQILPILEDKGQLSLLDIPGQGFYKQKVLDNLSNSKIIILPIDSTEKQSISTAAEYIYDILNSDQLDEDIPIIIACNKQDSKFPKSKKIIESELCNEIENIKQIKQKNNLEDSSQFGTLFSMKAKFSFSIFKNISFVECDRPSGYLSLITLIRQLI